MGVRGGGGSRGRVHSLGNKESKVITYLEGFLELLCFGNVCCDDWNVIFLLSIHVRDDGRRRDINKLVGGVCCCLHAVVYWVLSGSCGLLWVALLRSAFDESKLILL